MRIPTLLIAQRDAAKRTKTPSIWQVFGKKLSRERQEVLLKELFDPQAARSFAELRLLEQILIDRAKILTTVISRARPPGSKRRTGGEIVWSAFGQNQIFKAKDRTKAKLA